MCEMCVGVHEEKRSIQLDLQLGREVYARDTDLVVVMEARFGGCH